MKKILKIKNLIDTPSKTLSFDGDLNFIQLHYRLILHQRLSKFYTICNGSNLTVFDEVSNDNKII
jgi:hypothetical protein